jgi:O-antigen ligase
MAFKFFKIALPAFAALEILSFFAHTHPALAAPVFFVVLAMITALALWKMEYGVYFLLAELFLGGKGHLLEFNGISLRIAVFCVIMGIWVGKMIIKKQKPAFSQSGFFKYYLLLAVFALVGIGVGFLRGNDFSNIFLDANAWVYFLIAFPVFEVIKDEKHLKNILEIILAAVAVISLKTLGLFALFSLSGFDLHLAQAGGAGADSVIFDVYKWVRNSGAGEITPFGDFYRIFLQSQVFVMLGFFIELWLLVKKQGTKLLYILLALSSSALLISFSRSFWVGVFAGGIIFLYFLVKQNKWRETIKFSAKSGLAIIAGTLIAFAIAPGIFGAFGGRVSAGTGEVASASRINLLPKMWEKIKDNAILGSGFGATIAYETKDPRHPGSYETYAFEWGYLDILVKIGFLGLLAYLLVICKTFIALYKNNPAHYGLLCALIALCATNVFSPYLNHPLGIGAIILIGLVPCHPRGRKAEPGDPRGFPPTRE